MAEKTCFVVMGFGTKTDFPTGRTLDLDKTYRILIRPAVERAGLRCVRADEIVHAGSIDLSMYRQLLDALMAKPDPDSPVYTFLSDLQPPILKALERAMAEEESAPSSDPGPGPGDPTLSSLTEMAETAIDKDDFETAKALFTAARKLRHDDHLTHRLALATYKSKSPTEVDALNQAKVILQDLDPAVSNDPETLGLWGSVHKRLWLLTGERAALDTAILASQRGFDIRTDSYNGINLAFLLNLRVRVSSPADQIADFVTAERVRRRVIPLCLAQLDASVDGPDKLYWTMSTLAEAYLGIGDIAASEEWKTKADALLVPQWSATQQLASLRVLLEPSPLEMIREPTPPS